MTKYKKGNWELLYKCKDCSWLKRSYEFVCSDCGSADCFKRVVGRSIYKEGFFSDTFVEFQEKLSQPDLTNLLEK